MASKIGEIQHDRGYEFMRIPEPRHTVDFGATQETKDVGGYVVVTKGASAVVTQWRWPADYEPPTQTVPIGAWPFPEKPRA